MNILAIILIVSGAMFGLFALCVAIGCKSDPKVFKISLIVTLICVALLIIGIIISSASNSNKQEKIEEAVVLEIEQKIEKFTQGNPADNVKYEIMIGETKGYNLDIRIVYNIETTRQPEVINGKKFYPFYDYDVLFSRCDLESVEMSAYPYGEVYVNGELRMTKKGLGSSNSGSQTCSVCGTSYSNSEDVNSIQRRNMCTRCYGNYKYASNAADYAKDYN